MLSKSVDSISNMRLCLHAKIYLSRQPCIHLLSDLYHYSLKSLPYPYRLLIIPLIYPSTHAFSLRLTPLLCKETISVRDEIRMDSARLGRQIWQDLVGSARRCEGEEDGNRNVTAERKRTEGKRAVPYVVSFFTSSSEKRSTFTSLWLDVRRNDGGCWRREHRRQRP